jgi:hypothetical protein
LSGNGGSTSYRSYRTRAAIGSISYEPSADISARSYGFDLTQRYDEFVRLSSSCNQKTREGRTAMSEIRDVYSRITGKIIADLEQGPTKPLRRCPALP